MSDELEVPGKMDHTLRQNSSVCVENDMQKIKTVAMKLAKAHNHRPWGCCAYLIPVTQGGIKYCTM
jgi:hypothetical protein